MTSVNVASIYYQMKRNIHAYCKRLCEWSCNFFDWIIRYSKQNMNFSYIVAFRHERRRNHKDASRGGAVIILVIVLWYRGRNVYTHTHTQTQTHTHTYIYNIIYIIYTNVAGSVKFLIDQYPLTINALLFVTSWKHERSYINMVSIRMCPLEWRHNEWNGTWNHQTDDCLLSRLFWHKSKKTSNFRVSGLCEGHSKVTGEFTTQRASNTDNVSIWWRLMSS